MQSNRWSEVGLPISIGMVLLALITGGIGFYLFVSSRAPQERACTEEAKFCLDGSTVGRTGPNCEFAVCPEVKSGNTIMKKEENEGMMKQEGSSRMEKGDAMKGETMMNPSTGSGQEKEEGAPAPRGVEGIMVKYTGTVLAGKSAPLLEYNKADYDAAIASDKLVVLYFYANWCPTCKAEFPIMQEAFSELTTDKVIGFRVNYKDSDTEKDEENLAREFGIPYQHTKVFVKNGKMILKAPDQWDDMRYDMEISKYLPR